MATQTLHRPLYVTLLSGSAEAFDDEVFGSFSSVRSHSPVLIATVTTTNDSIAERPEAIPRPPPPALLALVPTTTLPPDAPVTTPPAPALEEPAPPRLSQHQQQQDITTCLPFVMGASQHQESAAF
ncbi:hypothetical protein K0M31_019793 [Melipona bicolor]|uniref:Uncharacterized protein n=1 Tax=Melipona bicolor TaxID=60889 RepID=A0AA40KRF2_9HYME|nr:hypothetical protein K0M31_019793 [Melipona bicolor]